MVLFKFFHLEYVKKTFFQKVFNRVRYLHNNKHKIVGFFTYRAIAEDRMVPLIFVNLLLPFDDRTCSHGLMAFRLSCTLDDVYLLHTTSLHCSRSKIFGFIGEHKTFLK